MKNIILIMSTLFMFSCADRTEPYKPPIPDEYVREWKVLYYRFSTSGEFVNNKGYYMRVNPDYTVSFKDYYGEVHKPARMEYGMIRAEGLDLQFMPGNKVRIIRKPEVNNHEWYFIVAPY